MPLHLPGLLTSLCPPSAGKARILGMHQSS